MIPASEILDSLFEGHVDVINLIMTKTNRGLEDFYEYLNEYCNADDEAEELIGHIPEAYRLIFNEVKNLNELGEMSHRLHAKPDAVISITCDDELKYFEVWGVYAG